MNNANQGPLEVFGQLFNGGLVDAVQFDVRPLKVCHILLNAYGFLKRRYNRMAIRIHTHFSMEATPLLMSPERPPINEVEEARWHIPFATCQLKQRWLSRSLPQFDGVEYSKEGMQHVDLEGGVRMMLEFIFLKRRFDNNRVILKMSNLLFSVIIVSGQDLKLLIQHWRP